MSKTPEQIEADQVLEAAVRTFAMAYGLGDPEVGMPQMLGDYVCVLEGLQFNDEGELHSDFYYLAFPHGNLPTAKAKGLLYQGLHMLDHGTRVE